MRKLTYFVACTVDGFIAKEDGSFAFFPSTGEHLRYIVEEYPETIPGHLREALGVRGGNTHFDTVLMGRKTYEVGLALSVTSPYAHLRQYVVSRTMATSPSLDVTLVSTDPTGLVRDLKREDGLDIWLCGGASLAAAVYGEIDELIVKVNPIVLGAGIGLFEGVQGPTTLELLDHRTFAGGVAIHRYGVVK
ncbi:MAG TPA: dihydrofolate reductase family protein [Pyrinomonadaceae bacterium]